MYAYLEGILKEININSVILDISGIGYDIRISSQTYNILPELEEKVRLFTELHLREDAWTLYGFLDKNEQKLFNQLRSISGVGAKTSLDIVGAIPLNDLAHSIASADTKIIETIKGIGKKTAQRIIVELKDKVDVINRTELNNDGLKTKIQGREAYEEDAIKALQNLGLSYSQIILSIEKIHPTLKDEEKRTDILIQKILEKIHQ